MHLDELRAFVAVVDRGSIAAASKALRFPIATLRRRLDELEIRLGVKLLERSPDGAVPTTAGVALVDRARALLSDANELWEMARSTGADPPRDIAVGIPPGLPPEIFSAFFKLMRELLPSVSWTFRIVEDLQPTTLAGLLAVMHLGDETPDASWTTHQLLSVKVRLVASRAYLARQGTPLTVEALGDHPILLWDGPQKQGDVLPLLEGGHVPIRPALRSSEVWLLRQSAVRGCGIAFIPAERPPRDAFSPPDDGVPVLEKTVGSQLKVSLLVRPSTMQSRIFSMSLEHVRRLMSVVSL